MTTRFQIVVLGIVAASLVFACKTREISSTGEYKRTLVFEDDFERAELGPGWKRGTGEGGPGQWRIEDGVLRADEIRNDPLWLTEELPRQVRVEFEAKALSPDGDIKFEIFGDGDAHESGYIVIYGGWKNALDVVARLDEHGDDRKAQPSRKVVPNTRYRIAAERTDSELRWYIDDDLVMTYSDDSPLMGRDHNYFALNNWSAPVEFDNVKVYELKGTR